MLCLKVARKRKSHRAGDAVRQADHNRQAQSSGGGGGGDLTEAADIYGGRGADPLRDGTRPRSATSLELGLFLSLGTGLSWR